MTSGRKSIQQKTLDTVQRIETVVVGVPGTDDRGMAGSIKEIKSDYKELARTVGQHTVLLAQHSEAIARLCSDDEPMSKKKKAGMWGGIGTIIASAVYGLVQLFKGGNTPS